MNTVQKPSIGSWISAPHPNVVEVMSMMGFDWLCLDMEHSPNNFLDLQSTVATVQSRDCKAFVRVAENSVNAIKIPLDIGVDGMIIPMICSAADARKGVEHCFYPPRGKRGVGLGRAHRYGLGTGFEDYLSSFEQDFELIMQVEHIDGVKQIDEILALEEIAGIFIGPYDLSGSMGIIGQLDHPELMAAVEEVSHKTLAAGKKLGAHVIPPDAQKVKDYLDLGYNFIALSTDMLLLGNKISDEMRRIKEYT